MNVPDVLKLKGIWHDVNPALDQRLFDRLRTVRDGPLELVYLDARHATRDQADRTRAAVGHVAVYIDPHWFTGDGKHKDLNGADLPDPITFRKIATAIVATVLQFGDPIMFDFEKIPVAWLREFLWGRASDGSSGWRGRAGAFTGGTNPSRPTAWTDASFQVGNWAAAIGDLVRAGFVLFVQLFYGNMDPVEEPLWALFEPILNGYDAAAVKPCYDGAHYPAGWHRGLGGFLFSTQRITSLFTLRHRLARRLGLKPDPASPPKIDSVELIAQLAAVDLADVTDEDAVPA